MDTILPDCLPLVNEKVDSHFNESHSSSSLNGASPQIENGHLDLANELVESTGKNKPICLRKQSPLGTLEENLFMAQEE